MADILEIIRWNFVPLFGSFFLVRVFVLGISIYACWKLWTKPQVFFPKHMKGLSLEAQQCQDALASLSGADPLSLKKADRILRIFGHKVFQDRIFFFGSARKIRQKYPDSGYAQLLEKLEKHLYAEKKPHTEEVQNLLRESISLLQTFV